MMTEPPRRHLLMLAFAVAILVLSVSGTFDGITDEAASVPPGDLRKLRPIRSSPARFLAAFLNFLRFDPAFWGNPLQYVIISIKTVVFIDVMV